MSIFEPLRKFVIGPSRSQRFSQRLNVPGPEVQFIPFGRRDGDGSTDFVDYAKLQRAFIQNAQDNEELRRWIKGRNPTLKVRLLTVRGFLSARYGENGVLYLGETTDRLTEIGYRFKVEHKRDYFDEASGEIFRLRASEVPYMIANHVIYGYKDRLQGRVCNTEPLLTGGSTIVTVIAPSGHWAEGHAVCSEEDPFDRAIGRTLALSRAFDRLNEVVSGS